jgi:AraC family transcriptional regulator
VTRKALTWDGLTAESVETTSSDRVEFGYSGPAHLLVVCERGARRAGETFVEGLPRSGLRELAGKISFVPEGREYRDWQQTRTPTRFIFIYFDPAEMQASDIRAPRMLFEDAMLLAASLRLMELIENPAPTGRLYVEALGVVLLRELERLNSRPSEIKQQIRGGLAAWQQRTVAAFIEDHLADAISLASLAQLVRLSPFHFSRAFKQSFGLPPHRYHVARRIERAKTLLVESAMSVTEIGFQVGFSETSAFSATFRRLTGTTPTAYTRNYA